MNVAQPWMLLLLVLVPLVGITAVLIARLRGRRWQVFMSNRLRPALLRKTPVFARWLSLVFLLGAVALLIGALARPQGDAGTRSETVKGRNILFALDLSRSMRVADVKPDRLSQGKAIIYEMMESMPNDRMGLVGFAGQSYLFAPLTVDHGAVRETVEQLDETWIPTGGSDLVGGLKFSIDVLKKTGVQNNALVLVSDGERHDGDLEEVIKEAEKAGVYVFAVGVGTEGGDWVPQGDLPGERARDQSGNTIRSQMQPDVLRKIAQGTKGRFVVAGTGEDIPALAKSALADLDHFELQSRERRVVVEFYQGPVGAALILLLASILTGTRWRKLAARTAVAATLAGSVSTSGAMTAKEATAALQGGRLEEARSGFHELAESARSLRDASRYRLSEGSAEYRAGHFRKAVEIYSQALLSDESQVDLHAHLGAGGALFNLGWQSLGSEEPYPNPPPEGLEAFDKLANAKLDELAAMEVPEEGESETFKVFSSVITDWTDAVRHFDSALRLQPDHTAAAQNRALVIRYLKRLEELFKEQSQESAQQIPQMGPGEGGEEGEPGEGGEGEEPGDGQGGEGERGNGSNGPEKGKGSGGEEEKDKNGGGGGKQPSDSNRQENAKKKLEENQDLQKGPLNPGRRPPRRPEKDW